jgi:hypothetical protein
MSAAVAIRERRVWVTFLAAMLAAECLAGPVAQQTRNLPDIPAPLGGEARWIARSMRLNGVPMTIKQFTTRANADDVLHHYESTLRKSSNMKTRRSVEGSVHVLAVMTDDYYATIRAKNTVHGAAGTITVTPPLANLVPRKHTRFPRPSTAQLVSLQEYDDDGLQAEHISLVSKRGVAIEAREFETALLRDGWELLRSEPSAKHRGSYVIEAQKAASLAFINLRRAERDATTIIVVWRKG